MFTSGPRKNQRWSTLGQIIFSAIIVIIKTGNFYFKIHLDMDKLTIGWSDGHTSEYKISWLADRRFERDIRTPHKEDIKRKQHYKTNDRLIKSIRFNDVSIYTV